MKMMRHGYYRNRGEDRKIDEQIIQMGWSSWRNPAWNSKGLTFSVVGVPEQNVTHEYHFEFESEEIIFMFLSLIAGKSSDPAIGAFASAYLEQLRASQNENETN